MIGTLPRPHSRRAWIALTVLVALLLAAVAFRATSPAPKKVSALFPEAVAVYVGTDVRVLGVNVGKVTRITPAGNAVRVDMQYDPSIDLPANAKAVVVTPTLVADRFVQLTPAYTGGRVLASGATIALPDTGVPVELDRIYRSLRDLVTTLGPDGANKNGTLNRLLETTAHALDGRGALANRTLVDLAAAAKTFGEGSGDLFASVDQLAKLTGTLSANDALVRAFLTDLAALSTELAGERGEIQGAVAAVARSIGTVGRFVGDNRAALTETLHRLTRVTGTIASQSSSISAALRTGPVAIDNLTVAYNAATGTIGSRISIKNNIVGEPQLLCSMVQQSQLPQTTKDLACRVFEQLQPVLDHAQAGQRSASPTAATQPTTASPSLETLMAGAR